MAKPPRLNTPQNYVFGRPAKFDLVAEAQALLEWSTKESSLQLQDFCEERDLITIYLSEWAVEDKNFGLALKKAKDRIAARRTNLVNAGAMNYGVYNRYQGMYDHLLREDERAEKAYEANLRNKVDDSNRSLDAQAIAKACKELDQKKQ